MDKTEIVCGNLYFEFLKHVSIQKDEDHDIKKKRISELFKKNLISNNRLRCAS